MHQEAATPQESVIQPEAATSISGPGIAALGDLQQALEAAPYDISSEWEIENSARFNTLASFLTATPFELAIRKQK